MVKDQYNLDEATKILSKHYTRNGLFQWDDSNNPIFRWVSHKIRHSYAVLYAAQRIMTIDPTPWLKDQKNQRKIEIASLLHDIGRFYEHNGRRIFGKGEFDHGDIGYYIAQSEWYTDPSILLAIRYHNKLNPLAYQKEELYFNSGSEEQNDIALILQSIRDADKLQNIEYFIADHGQAFVMGSWGWELCGDICTEVLDIFLDRRMIPHEQVRTFAEMILNIYSWKYDINLPGTKELVSQSKLDQFVINTLTAIGTSHETIAKIQWHR